MSTLSLEVLRILPAKQRLQYVRDHEAELSRFTSEHLDVVSTLILQGAPNEMKTRLPIIEDRKQPVQGDSDYIEFVPLEVAYNV